MYPKLCMISSVGSFLYLENQTSPSRRREKVRGSTRDDPPFCGGERAKDGGRGVRKTTIEEGRLWWRDCLTADDSCRMNGAI